MTDGGIKAAEKSLAILRASPEQATANLASGVYSRAVRLYRLICWFGRWAPVERSVTASVYGMRDEER